MTSPRRKRIKYRYWARKFPNKAYRRGQILVAKAIRVFEKEMEESPIGKAYLAAFEKGSENPILIKLPSALRVAEVALVFRLSLGDFRKEES